MMAMDAPLKDSQDSPTHANDVGGGGLMCLHTLGRTRHKARPTPGLPGDRWEGQKARALLQLGLRWPLALASNARARGLSQRHPAAHHPQSSSRACPVSQERCP